MRFPSRAASVNAANKGRPNEYSSMLTSTVTMPPAIACPGLSVVVKVTTARVCSTMRTRSANPLRPTTSARSAAGHNRIGAAKYQIANVAGSHASTARMKRVSGERWTPTLAASLANSAAPLCTRPPEGELFAPWGGPAALNFGPRRLRLFSRRHRCARRRRRWRCVMSIDTRQRPHPDQPDDQHVQHDQRLPDIKMRPFEDVAIPLSEIEQADHTDDVQALHSDNAGSEPHEPVRPWRRKCKDRRNQDDRGFDTVATGLDRHRESARRRTQYLAGRRNARIEPRDQHRRNVRQRSSPWLDKPALQPRRQLESKQQREQGDEPDEEADHRSILTTRTGLLGALTLGVLGALMLWPLADYARNSA